MILKKHYRVDEVTQFVPYKASTIRKKLANREIAFVKCGRIVMIPESEIERLQSEFYQRVELEKA